jgi:hypothetical protein
VEYLYYIPAELRSDPGTEKIPAASKATQIHSHSSSPAKSKLVKILSLCMKGGNGGFALEAAALATSSGSIGNMGFVSSGHSIKETLGNKISHGDYGVGMMVRLLVKNIASIGKGA